MKNYSIGLRIWIKEENEGHFLGTGRVQLLENIKSTGSITKAAAAMKMSYRQAWQMVEDINTSDTTPYVEKTLGGKGGGGAKITKEGEDAIKKFHEIEDKLYQYAKQLESEFNY